MPEAPHDRPTIRTAEEGDVAGLLALWDRARSVAASIPDDEESVRTLLRRDPSSLLIAERDGRLVGALIAGWDGWRGSVYRLAVEPEHWHLGIGSQLVAEAERRLRELGARRISAIVGSGEEGAREFWRSVGYEQDHAVERFVKNL